MASIIKTVVQTTNKTTPVTANYKNCIIQTVVLTDAADTQFAFDVINKKYYPEQNIQLTVLYAGTGTPIVALASTTRFGFTIRVTNVGTAVLNGALSINVAVINS
jgi:hypothetical protein